MNCNILDKVLRSRVSDGCMLLDAMVPNWHEKINVNKLNIGSCLRCVIGQLFGHFNRENLSKVGLTWDNAHKWGLCFDVNNYDETNNAKIIMNKLTIIWKEVISERQNKINEDLIELPLGEELIEV